MSKPSPTSHPGYFQQYIDLVPDEDLLTGFANQTGLIKHLPGSITEEKSTYAYAPGKWTLKELLQHIIDTERIFSYRAMCFARKEIISLPGFDENEYAANSFANNRTWQSLADEFLAVRHSTELLFKSFTTEALSYIGTANNNPVSVASIGFIALGHFYHHKKIIEERYL
jgi:hypothetical protein